VGGALSAAVLLTVTVLPQARANPLDPGWPWPATPTDQSYVQGLQSAGIYLEMPIKMAHNICGSIQHGDSPKDFDDNNWWSMPEDKGRIVTKAAITSYCPQYLSLEYW
jgi:hypothetical protein